MTWIDPETQEFRSEPDELRALVGERAARVRARCDVLRAGPGDPHRRRRPGAGRLGDQADGVLPGLRVRGRPERARPGRRRARRRARAAAGPGCPGREHHLDVVELSRVSAEMRRDEAAISDRNDERTSERFTIAVAADIDPAHVAKQWYVNDYDFGTKYLRQTGHPLGEPRPGRRTAPRASIAGERGAGPAVPGLRGLRRARPSRRHQPRRGAPGLVPLPQGPRRARPEHRADPDPDDPGRGDPAAAVGHARRPVRRSRAWPRRCCSACTSRSAAAPTTSTSRRSASPSPARRR